VALSWSHNTAIIHEKTNQNLIVIIVIYSSELRDVVNKRKRAGRWI